MKDLGFSYRKKSSKNFWIELFASIVCLSFGIFAISDYIVYQVFPPKKLNELEVIKGKAEFVSESVAGTRYTDHATINYTINGIPFSYYDHFPNYQKVKYIVQKGGVLTAWIDPGEFEDTYGKPTPWQIADRSQVWVSYEDRLKERTFNSKVGLWLGAVLLFLGLACGIQFWRHHMR